MTAILALILAAVPIHWDVETSTYRPAAFDVVRGESIRFKASFKTYGTPLEITGEPYLYYQTNGMDTAWWRIPATVSNSTVTATFAPTNDCGAAAYSCFLGVAGSNYRAAFRLNMRPGPGAVPTEIPFPVRSLDFATVTVFNAPYYLKTNTYTKAETDARIIELAPPAPPETDPVFSSWLAADPLAPYATLSDVGTVQAELEAYITENDQRVQILGYRLDEYDSRIGNLATRLTTAETDISILTSDMSMGFTNLGNQLSSLSSTVSSQGVSISSLSYTVSGHTTSISNLSSTVSGHTTAIAAKANAADVFTKAETATAATNAAEAVRTSHPYLESHDGGIFVVVPE